jgi:hypothetical protein
MGGCETNDGGTAGCQLSQETVLAATPLTLLPNARLDSVGAGFALSGIDADGATVRWASVDASGAAGSEHALTVPVASAGPWLAFAAAAAPGDTLLVATAEPAANGTDAELHVSAASATAATPAGVAAPAAGPALATLAGALAGGATPDVVLGASRSGAHAALAWIDAGAGGVEVMTLTAAGQPVGKPTLLEKAPSFACLGFVRGRDALTLIYYRYDDANSQVPVLVVTDLLESGSIDMTLDLRLDPHDARCPAMAVTPAGYALAFEDNEGVWLGIYDASSNDLAFTPFAASTGLGGAALLPPLEGLAPLGTDYGVVFARAYGGELWRLDPHGHRRSGALEFPSASGHIGEVSTQAVAGTMFATYADYTSEDAGTGTAGQRYFLGATCL